MTTDGYVFSLHRFGGDKLVVGSVDVIEVYRLKETGFEKMSKEGGEEVVDGGFDVIGLGGNVYAA